MALRQIDNALPISTGERDRPKKQANVTAPPVQNKPSDVVVNDENRVPLPVPVPSGNTDSVVIDYVSSEDLKPVSDPESKLQGLIQDLDSKNWIKLCESINDARRFLIYHSTLLLPCLAKVMLVLVKAIKNPRSALCKTSIMASSDFFKAYGDKLLEHSASDAFDNLLLQLLLKASQDKRFVCEEADKTLNAMVQSITPPPLLQKLHGYVSHNNLRVRAKAAVSISNCISRMGPEDLKEFGLETLIRMASDILNDKLPEAREAARGILMSLYKSFSTENEDEKQESWQNFCQSNLPALYAQSVVKITLPQ